MVKKRRLRAEKGRQPPFLLVCPFRSHTVTNYIAPTGNLDSRTGADIMNLLQEINQESRQTIIMVTHSPEAAKSSSRIITVSDGKIS